MPDLTVILAIVAIAAAVGGFFLFARRQAADKPTAPVATPAPATEGPSKAEVALQVALRQAIDKLHASVPVQPEKAAPAVSAVLAPLGAAPSIVLPVTAPTWQEPPSPWPIDARALSPEQIAALSPDATARANMWQQALMSAAITGNGLNPVPAALMIYRAGFTKTEDLNKPLDETWQRVFAAYGVPVPVPDNRPWTGNPSTPRPSEAAYDVRLQQ